jgi:toxin FitB
MRFLSDTNVLSEVMRAKPEPKVVRWFVALDRVAMSVVTLEELIFGLRRRSLLRKEAWLRQMLADKGEVLPVTDAAARWSGEKRSFLESTGRAATQADSLIAACAWEHGLILATRNVKDFQGFGIPVLNPFE